MQTKIWGMAAFICATAIAGAAVAQNFTDVIRARQGQFYIMEYNLRVLEDMAANRMPYDREVAKFRANNIYLATRLHQDVNWLPGSDREDTPRTMAIDVRKNPELFKKSWATLMRSADELKTMAADGPPMSLGQATGDTRKTCNLCHSFYRKVL